MVGAAGTEKIPYGLRRYPLAVGLFGLGGLGFFAWAGRITAPTFVFPFGLLAPDTARVVIAGVGVAALGFTAALTYVKFGVRPQVELAPDRVVLPVGEFGLRSVVLRPGEVTAVHDTTTAGGWKRLQVVTRGEVHEVPSSRLPDDAGYARVKSAVEALIVGN